MPILTNCVRTNRTESGTNRRGRKVLTRPKYNTNLGPQVSTIRGTKNVPAVVTVICVYSEKLCDIS